MENSLLTIFPWSTVVQGNKQIYLNPQQINGETIGGKRNKSRKRKQKGGKRKAKRRKSRKKRGGAGCKSKKDCGGNKLCLPGGTQNIKDGPGECVPKPVFVSHMKVRGQEKKDARATAKEAAKAAPQVDTSSLTSTTTSTPPALSPEEKASNEDEGTPEVIPAGEGEKILKEMEAKKAKAETTPAAGTTSEVVPTTPEVVPTSLPPPPVKKNEESCTINNQCESNFCNQKTKKCDDIPGPPSLPGPPPTPPPTVETPAVTTPAVTTPAVTTPAAVTPVKTEPKLETGYSKQKMTEAQKKQMEVIKNMTEAQLTARIEQILKNAQEAIAAESPAAGGYKKKRKKRRKKRKTKRKNKSKKNKSKKHKKRC
jgi:hypothetical protein